MVLAKAANGEVIDPCYGRAGLDFSDDLDFCMMFGD